MGDLQVLLKALSAHRQALNLAPANDEPFLACFQDLPLFHRLGQPPSGEDAAKLQLLPSPPKQARAELGTDEMVFTAFGRGFEPVPNPPVLLAFGPVIDAREGRSSSPWDSRGVASQRGNGHEVLGRYSLAAPEDEEFLPQYLAAVFETWNQYLTHGPPLHPAPEHLVTPDSPPFLSSLEARFDRPINLGNPLPDGPRLLAVFFDPQALTERGEAWKQCMAGLRALATRRGAKRVAVDRSLSHPDFPSAVSRFVREWLAEAGGPL